MSALRIAVSGVVLRCYGAGKGCKQGIWGKVPNLVRKGGFRGIAASRAAKEGLRPLLQSGVKLKASRPEPSYDIAKVASRYRAKFVFGGDLGWGAMRQASRVSVDAKNMAWLTADRTCS